MAFNNKILNSTPSTSIKRLKDKRNPKIWYYTQNPYSNKPKKYWDKQYILYYKYCTEEPYGIKCVTNF